MLPKKLLVPQKAIKKGEETRVFCERVKEQYPFLHQDFILQVFYEHPDLFDELFPKFNIELHSVQVREISVAWIIKNVRYFNNEQLDSSSFWGEQFKKFLQFNHEYKYDLFEYMIKNKTWPLMPIIVKKDYALFSLGATEKLGKPYHLFEGTHRISYLLEMNKLGMVSLDSIHKLIEITYQPSVLN